MPRPMTSTRPYLIRAFYDWIVDNDFTPHIVVNATANDVYVPMEYVENGQIVLNIAVTAVHGLILGDQAIEFQARFGGKVRKVHVPVSAIMAIYAKENGRGMVLSDMDEGDAGTQGTEGGNNNDKGAVPEGVQVEKGDDKSEGSKGGKGKTGGKPPHLTVVK